MLWMLWMLAVLAAGGSLRPVSAPVLGRRAAIASISTALLVPRASHAESAVITSGDAFQLRASYKVLAGALDAWAVDIAQIQLGNDASSFVAVTGINDQQLGRLSQVSSDSADAVNSFKKNRDLLLQNLYLARGAARYEKDPAVARGYENTARLAALAAQTDLAAIAREAGVEVPKGQPPQPAPEDAIVFTPRAAPKEENRLIL